MNNHRTVARRDSATSILRKIGINPRDYNLFIAQKGDGYEVNVGQATLHVEKMRKLAAPAEKAASKIVKANGHDRQVKKAEDKKPTAKRAGSVAAAIRELIAAGQSNEEVWAEVQPRFSMPDTKKHYPAWYRAEMVRKGML